MRRQKIIRGFVVIATLAFVFGGCGKKTWEIPELEDPVISSVSLTPVEYGIVGGDNFECSVTAKEYCFFWETECTVKEICVERGQFVEAGTVLACANTDEAKKAVDELRTAIGYSNAQFEIDEEMYIYDHQQLELDLVLAKDARQDKLADEIEKQMLILEENHRFDVMYHEFEISGYEKELKEKEKLVQNGKLVASQQGYVTYIKDLSGGNTFFPGENVVILTDYDQLYLESDMKAMSTSKKVISKVYYVYYKGERVPLTEIPYTKEEEVVAENRDQELYRRFELDRQRLDLPVGTYLMGTQVEKKDSEQIEVLRVLNDAIDSDDFGDFVYVVKDGVKEQRYVQVGKKDKKYAQIYSGLEVGEYVSYSFKTPAPVQYEKYECKTRDYVYNAKAQVLDPILILSNTVIAEYDGKVIECSLIQGESVNKGDLLCAIQTENGKAKLTELSSQLSRLTRDYEMQCKAFEEQVKNCNDMKIGYANMREEEIYAIWHPDENGEESEEEADEEDAGLSEAERQRLIDAVERKYGFLFKQVDINLQSIEAQKRKAALEYEHEYSETKAIYDKLRTQNDGDGVIRIYAPIDAILGDVYIKNGESVAQGEVLFNLYEVSEKICRFSPKEALLPGQSVTLINKKTREQISVSVVAEGGKEKAYITDLNGKLYVTKNKEINKRSYARVPDDFDMSTIGEYEMYYPAISMSQVITVPKGTVKEEVVEGENTVKYFVWCVVNDQLVKRYVDDYLLMADAKSENEELECVFGELHAGDIVAIEK